MTCSLIEYESLLFNSQGIFMRKFIIFLFFIPALASLGHDIYIFQQNQDKGFQLTDLGALWDKYDKKSHDQWKDKVRQISETVADLTPEQLSILTTVSLLSLIHI